MLQVTMNPAPGLSAAADRALAGSDLRTRRYRRWVEHAQLASAALGLGQAGARVVDRERLGVPARIGVPSAASGTLSRLP